MGVALFIIFVGLYMCSLANKDISHLFIQSAMPNSSHNKHSLELPYLVLSRLQKCSDHCDCHLCIQAWCWTNLSVLVDCHSCRLNNAGNKYIKPSISITHKCNILIFGNSAPNQAEIKPRTFDVYQLANARTNVQPISLLQYKKWDLIHAT